MKIAAGLIAMFLGLLVLMQSCAVATTASLTEAQAIENAGSVGVLVGLLFFLAGAFAFGLPAVSTFMLVVAALFALAASGDFEDLGIWAWAAFLLAAMAGWAWRTARRTRAKETGAAIVQPGNRDGGPA